MGFDEVYRSLSDLGYRVEAGIFSSSETGGSHQRKRLFILAKLAGSESKKPKGHTERKESKQPKFGKSSKNVNTEMANANNIEPKTTKGISRWEKQKPYNGDGIWNNVKSDGSNQMANTNSERDSKSNSTYWQSERIPIAPPGQFQYEWEEPRQNTKNALKSRLGLSVANGYDYRTYLLRALGNGVDPWTAAKAFETLYSKLNYPIN